MSEIEKMQRYIANTRITNGTKERYTICLSELDGIHQMAKKDPFRALCLAFNYGQAKGYRLANAEKKAVRA